MKGAQIVRLRMNIKDLLLAKVPCLTNQGKPAATVSFSKHLCGAATDLTLACLSRYHKDLRLSFHDENQVIQGTDGILVALCCHHRCTFDSYINLDYLQSLGIDKFEFDCISRMSSWATCGEREVQPLDTNGTPVQSDNEDDHMNAEVEDAIPWSHKPKLSHEERRSIGLKCKRLLDKGRLEHLRQEGFSAGLIEFVGLQSSLENIAIWARRN